MGADFRLKKESEYEKWYSGKFINKEYIAEREAQTGKKQPRVFLFVLSAFAVKGQTKTRHHYKP